MLLLYQVSYQFYKSFVKHIKNFLGNDDVWKNKLVLHFSSIQLLFICEFMSCYISQDPYMLSSGGNDGYILFPVQWECFYNFTMLLNFPFDFFLDPLVGPECCLMSTHLPVKLLSAQTYLYTRHRLCIYEIFYVSLMI